MGISEVFWLLVYLTKRSSIFTGKLCLKKKNTQNQKQQQQPKDKTKKGQNSIISFGFCVYTHIHKQRL